MSVKYVINQIHRFDFLTVNDFCVYLRGLHIGMSEQLAGGIKVDTEGKHHRGERMAAAMKRYVLCYPALFHHLFQRFTDRSIVEIGKHEIILLTGAVTLNYPQGNIQ